MQKLLIAVKHEIICDALLEMFGDLEILTCHSGQSALEILNNLRPDVLVIDLSLPGIDGLTVLHQANYKPPSIIALTCVTTDLFLEEAYNAGVTELIAVPCTLALIADRLRSCLQKIPSPGH